MTEYLINVGDFNIIVLPAARQYFILGHDAPSMAVQDQFVQGQPIAYESMRPLWFQYRPDESWKDFDQKPGQLGTTITEDQLIDMYVLKKYNFGSLVAVRDRNDGKVKVFKRDMLQARA
jgi:hypothetical protein